jgi:hypothetical protein
LQLAESLIARQMERARGGHEELLLYLDVLTKQGRFTEAATLLRSEDGSRMSLLAERRALLAEMQVSICAPAQRSWVSVPGLETSS